MKDTHKDSENKRKIMISNKDQIDKAKLKTNKQTHIHINIYIQRNTHKHKQVQAWPETLGFKHNWVHRKEATQK